MKNLNFLWERGLKIDLNFFKDHSKFPRQGLGGQYLLIPSLPGSSIVSSDALIKDQTGNVLHPEHVQTQNMTIIILHGTAT